MVNWGTPNPLFQVRIPAPPQNSYLWTKYVINLNINDKNLKSKQKEGDGF